MKNTHGGVLLLVKLQAEHVLTYRKEAAVHLVFQNKEHSKSFGKRVISWPWSISKYSKRQYFRQKLTSHIKVCSPNKMIPNLYFSVSQKFRECYITRQWGKYRIRMLLYTFMTFWHLLVLFPHEISVFIIFISVFDKVTNFCIKILTNQKQELVTRNFLIVF